MGRDVDIDFRDASQTNRGDANVGTLGSAAAVDQSLDLDQSDVNGGFGGVASGDDVWWW